jgi:formate dehydrogenase maturation protein FdhE
MTDLFQKRFSRAETLELEWPFAAEILAFFKEVTAAQKQLYSQIVAEEPEQFRPHLLLWKNWVAPFMDRIERAAPEKFREHIPAWRHLDPGTWESTLLCSWNAQGLPLSGHVQQEDELYPLFGKMILQPYAAWLYRRSEHLKEPKPDAGECPSCSHLPGVSVLREDKKAETVRRSLLCSFCPTEWEFARVVCPSCKEERPEKLPRYTAQEIPWMRLEACDTCGKFLKSVDLTLNWEADPVVDEVASTPLDVIAHEHGYTKIAVNLIGI